MPIYVYTSGVSSGIGKTNVTHPTDTHRINNCHFHYIIM